MTRILGPTEADFGVVIAASPRHLHWVRGVCASVGYFLDDTPICVLLDGDADTTDLTSGSGARVIRPAEVEHRELRELSFGSQLTKLTAQWLSPFETYLMLDADAIVWGDIRSHADFDRFDFILDSPMGVDIARRYVMDAEAVSRHFPDFDMTRHLSEYANVGAYFARRGMLGLDEYLELVRLLKSAPGMFYADQGLLNFMVFKAADDGKVRLDQRPLQVTTGDTMREEVVRRFGISDSRPHVVGDPVVLHWVGTPKPRVRERGRDYFAPMTFFRREFRRAARGGGSSATDDLWLRFEDMICTDYRGSNLRGRVAGLRRRARKRYARTRVALRSHTPDRVVAAVRRRPQRSGRE